MSVLSGVSDFFGLDVGTTAVRAVELRGTANPKTYIRHAYLPIDPKISMSDSKADQLNLSQQIKDFLSKNGFNLKNVAVGLPSSRIFSTVIDIDNLSDTELAKTIRLQADSIIPTPIDESKIDWAKIGPSPQDANKVEVVLSSVTNVFAETRLDMLESIGLNIIAFEPDSMALARALVPVDAVTPQVVIDIGSMSTDLVIIWQGAPRLTRSIPTGTEALVKSASQNLSIDMKQSEQFVFKFGLSRDKLEGQIYNAIISTIDLLVGEIEKSVKFFNARYTNTKVDRIILTGGASALPEFPLYIANKFGISVEIGNAWRNIAFPTSKQNELLSVSNHFAVAAGLAERQE